MRLAIVALCLAACRGGPTVVIYAGPPVSACPTGRAYPVPPANAPIVAFVPLASPPPVEDSPPPPVEEPDATPDEPKKPPPKKKPPNKKPPRKKGSP